MAAKPDWLKEQHRWWWCWWLRWGSGWRDVGWRISGRLDREERKQGRRWVEEDGMENVAGESDVISDGQREIGEQPGGEAGVVMEKEIDGKWL